MNISLEKYQQDLQKNYLALKKASEQVKKDYQKVINDSFTESNWNDEGKKITLDMRNFENIVKDLGKKIDYLQNADIEINDIESTIKKVESEIYNAKTNIEPMIGKIRDKVRTYACNFELAVNQEEQKIKEEKGQEILQDLMNNKDLLLERRKNLEDIHKTAANIKSITDQMAIDVNNQGAILDEIEAKVEDSEEKAHKSKEEIIASDKISKSNRKCYMFFVIITIASLVGIGFLVWFIIKKVRIIIYIICSIIIIKIPIIFEIIISKNHIVVFEIIKIFKIVYIIVVVCLIYIYIIILIKIVFQII